MSMNPLHPAFTGETFNAHALEAMLKAAGMAALAEPIRRALQSDPQFAHVVAEALAIHKIAACDFSTLQ